jgi:hypothetical protein
MQGDRQLIKRDAALRKLTRINRWLIAGSVALTGALAEVAAQAFPGKTVKTAAGASGKAGAAKRHTGRASGSPAPQPPAQAPQSAPESSGSARAAESTPAQGTQSQETHSTQESTPRQESAPSQESNQQAAPAQEAPHAKESTPAPAESSPPVVSGGS